MESTFFIHFFSIREQITHFRRENIFLDRFLERIDNSQVLQIAHRELKGNQRNRERWTRLPPIQRRWSGKMIRESLNDPVSFKKYLDSHSELSGSQGHSLWIHAFRAASSNLRMQKKKYSLAMQELEHMHLDWQTEKKNTEELLKNLEVNINQMSSILIGSFLDRFASNPFQVMSKMRHFLIRQ